MVQSIDSETQKLRRIRDNVRLLAMHGRRQLRRDAYRRRSYAKIEVWNSERVLRMKGGKRYTLKRDESPEDMGAMFLAFPDRYKHREVA